MIITLIFVSSGKPYPPLHVLVYCGHGEGSVTWQSSYFGYEHQYSIVQFSTDNVNFVNGTRVTTENIKQEIYQTRVYNLQYGTHYFLRVLTINAHGFSTSSVKNCSIGAQEGVYLASLFNRWTHRISNIKSIKNINIDLNLVIRFSFKELCLLLRLFSVWPLYISVLFFSTWIVVT